MYIEEKEKQKQEKNFRFQQKIYFWRKPHLSLIELFSAYNYIY